MKYIEPCPNYDCHVHYREYLMKKHKALKKWAKKHGLKIHKFKVAKVTPGDMMGNLVPPDWVPPRNLADLFGKDPQASIIDKILTEPAPDEGKGLSTGQLLHYAGVHSQRMNDEGYSKTALVIEWLAGEIERLRDEVVRLNNECIELNKRVTR